MIHVEEELEEEVEYAIDIKEQSNRYVLYVRICKY